MSIFTEHKTEFLCNENQEKTRANIQQNGLKKIRENTERIEKELNCLKLDNIDNSDSFRFTKEKMAMMDSLHNQKLCDDKKK